MNKVQEFHILLDTENPDIVIGTESWLLPDIARSEVFPVGYQSFRADRTSKASRGRGVFILVRNKFPCTEQPQFQTKCEIIRVKLGITGNRPLLIGAYYRPGEDDLEGLQELQNSISGSMTTVIMPGFWVTSTCPSWTGLRVYLYLNPTAHIIRCLTFSCSS